MVDPAKAIDTAKHLPPTFLADVSVLIDPRRAREVIGKVPATLVGDVAAELTKRGELVTMGRFVGYVNDNTVRAAMERIDDPALLRIAFTMEGKERLSHMISLLPDERLTSVMQAADREQLWPEALDLLDHVSHELKVSIGERAAAQPGLLESLARAAGEQDLWDAMLPVVAELPPQAKDQVAGLAATLDTHLLERVIEVVGENDLWSVFVPLAADHMDLAGRERVAEMVASVPDEVIQGLADAVERDRLWPSLLTIADSMTPEQLSRIADRLLSAGLEERLPTMIDAVEETGLWKSGLTLLAGLDPALKERLAPVAATLGEADRAKVLDHARELGLLDGLGPLAGALGSAN
jgi:hypothetical protein